MKSSPKTVGFMQAAGLALYVCLFAVSVPKVQGWIELNNVQLHPAVGITLFLLAFIISVLICGAIIFGYPAKIFLEGKHGEAAKMVLWSGIWLIIIFIITAVLSLLLALL